MSLFASVAYAAGEAAPAAPAGGAIMSFLPLAIIFAIFYFLLIRPQQKKQKEHKELLTNLKVGDRVISNSGIYGSIVKLSEKNITLQIADGVKVKIVRSAIADVVKTEEE
ncbi:MAG: preprotein translocase subunit YajC [Nitrospirota bacterium]|nr:preprotein translocase subunit YajC [Nitrospirota bacterium]